MPFVPRLFIKTGVIYLALTFVLGALFLTLEAFGRPIPFTIAVEHGHMGFVGWLVNTVVGVALWLLPVNRKAFPETQGRYPEKPARTAFAALNAGLILRLVFEPVQSSHASVVSSAALIASAILQLGGILIVASIAWLRIYPLPNRPDV